ncbi:MAG: hypothetical protein WAX79_00780, partial [Candidatus Omnitrophota bacterium]
PPLKDKDKDKDKENGDGEHTQSELVVQQPCNNGSFLFIDAVVKDWNVFCDKYPSLSKIKEITESRRKSLKQRYEKESFRDFSAILVAIEEQPFLLEGNPNAKEHKNWRISFDWLIANDINYIKVLERKYKDNIDPLAKYYKKE